MPRKKNPTGAREKAGVASVTYATKRKNVPDDLRDRAALMITRNIRTFMSRDWRRARDAKDDWWAERVRRLGPAEAFRIADELRRQALAQHPDWPDAASRADDLRHHVRLAELFARADAIRRP